MHRKATSVDFCHVRLLLLDWSYLHHRNFLIGDEPLVFRGVELFVPRVRSRWVDLCEEEDKLMGKLENVRPTGVESFLVNAPLTVKDISLPKTLCLSSLLEASLLEPIIAVITFEISYAEGNYRHAPRPTS